MIRRQGAAWVAALAALSFSATASAWGSEGHEITAAVARHYLTPQVRDRVDHMLAADQDPLTAHDMLNESNWADHYRESGHRETGEWHYVDIELDHPDLTAACFDFPAAVASEGPAHDCVVNKINEFARELASPATSPRERLLALKFLLHFVGDLHQPLHDVDNHDKGGNCVLLNLGGPRQVNLHAYWDTVIVQSLGNDPQAVAATLIRDITPAKKTAWQEGDPQAWAMEGFTVARHTAYTLGSKPGCGLGQPPIRLTPGYEAAARKTASVQLEKAGVRLAALLNRSLGS